jgi:polyisoprenoid-binding protein YceI
MTVHALRRSVTLAVAAAGIALSAASFAAPAPAPTGTYKIDPIHSHAIFEIGHLSAISRFYGRFNDINGEFVVDTPEKSTVKVEIKVESVDTKTEAIDKHLKSPDFFSAVQFPTMTFTSTSVKLGANGEGTLAGNLTVRGVTKPVTWKLKHVGTGKGMKGEQRVGYLATTIIKRTDFGMSYGPGAATDEVELRVALEGIKQ